MKLTAPTINRPALLTREQAAEFLGIKINTLDVWRFSRRYSLPFIRVGRSIRYRLPDLENFLEKRTVRPAADGE